MAFKNKNRYVESHATQRAKRRKRLNLIGVSLSLVAALIVFNQWHSDSGDNAANAEKTIASRTIAENTSAEQNPTIDEQAAQTKSPSLFKRLFRTPAQIAPEKISIDKAFLRNALSSYIDSDEYPSSLGYNDQILNIDYTLDQDLQSWAKARLARHNPDYGAFVALDPDTGKILAMVNNYRNPTESDHSNLTLQNTFPAASTFKLITAAALLEEKLAKPDTVYAFNGKSTSLYKNQVFQVKENKRTRRMNLKTAFAKSVNPIFGRIGAKYLGGETLLKYAERFGFNAQFISDFDFDNGRIEIDLQNDWQAAEAASGYTRRNTLSPIHGAVLAASVINGGKLISPSIVQSVRNDKGELLYQANNTPGAISVLDAQSARSMQKLMGATIKEGTARKTFRRFNQKRYKDVKTGGKSGHLSGAEPKGNYDWFIGYGERGEQKIAYAMLCINKEKWYVKSAQFAREALEHYFKNAPEKITSDKIQSAQTSS